MRELVEPKLPRQQFGCRPGHSTAQALMRLMHYSGITAGNGNQFGAILYDFTKAYDRVPKHVLIKKMIKLEIPAYLIKIVYEWLSKDNSQCRIEIMKQESEPNKTEYRKDQALACFCG